MYILRSSYFREVFPKYLELVIEDNVFAHRHKNHCFSYVDIIIFAGIHVAHGGPVKCRNLGEIREDKKLKNQEIKHSKRDYP